MSRDFHRLRRDALRIWQAGLEAVRSERLVRETLRVEGAVLVVGEERLRLDGIRRIAVVGAGKAGAGMAAAVEDVLGPRLMEEKQLTGWLNVPADCCRAGILPACSTGILPVCGAGVTPATEVDAAEAGRMPALQAQRIKLHAARPAGVNEPTPAGVAGAEEILRIVASLGPDDLCLCLISGGGSALMPAPVEGITLDDKLAVTRYLSAVGANIEQLNTVRKQLSRIKGGGLARACRAGRLVSLIISDVLGDPLDVIASGPTVEDTSTPRAALDVLDAFAARDGGVSPAIFEYLEERDRRVSLQPRRASFQLAQDELETVYGAAVVLPPPATAKGRQCNCRPNECATRHEPHHRQQCHGRGRGRGRGRAAGLFARDDLCQPVGRPGRGDRPPFGRHGDEDAEHARAELPDQRRRAGRHAVRRRAPRPGRPQPAVGLSPRSMRLMEHGPEAVVLLSGGTDGEDGPTDAAGAVVDAEVIAAARQCQLDPADYLARNDAYNFFRRAGGLIRTGPTHTNVCDVPRGVGRAEGVQAAPSRAA